MIDGAATEDPRSSPGSGSDSRPCARNHSQPVVPPETPVTTAPRAKACLRDRSSTTIPMTGVSGANIRPIVNDRMERIVARWSDGIRRFKYPVATGSTDERTSVSA